MRIRTTSSRPGRRRCRRLPAQSALSLDPPRARSRYFGIRDLLDEKTARRIWDRANEALPAETLRTHGILKTFDVRALCTTDDPAESLEWHAEIAGSGLATRVYPTFRPDRALDVHAPETFNAWLDRLAATSDVHIARFDDLLDALAKRHQAFHDVGGRLSDHGLAYCYADPFTEANASAIFDRAPAGHAATPDRHARFAAFLMLFFGRLDAEKGWTKQLHLGALRNVNIARAAHLRS